jgi:hypothetical protein
MFDSGGFYRTVVDFLSVPLYALNGRTPGRPKTSGTLEARYEDDE